MNSRNWCKASWASGTPACDGERVFSSFVNGDAGKTTAVQAEDGTEVLILFTSPERAKSFVKDFPGYEGGLLTDFKWVLEKTGSGHGISLNPGWDVGIDMEPEMVQQLTQAQRSSP